MKALMFFGIIFFGLFIWFYMLPYKLDWCKDCKGKISFKKFLQMYEVNPARWMLYTGFVRYEKPGPHGKYYKFDSVPLCFSFIDCFRYILWKWRRDRKEEQASNALIMCEVIESWQNDMNEKEKTNESGVQ